MKIGKMNVRKLRRTLRELFGAETPWSREGNYCFVHLDGARSAERSHRVETFEPTRFFDPSCPHCKPFLDDGAIMIFTGEDVLGMRLLGGGRFETVMLRREPALVASAN
jgi:hypothetical protein